MVTMRATAASMPETAFTTASPGRMRAGGHRAGIAAERMVGPVDISAPACGTRARRRARSGSAPSSAVSSVVPEYQGIRVLRRGDVVAVARADRNGGHRQRSELAEQRVEVGDDLVEHRLVEADQVHLVDRQHHLADAQQRGDRGVPAGLHQQALARIHQQHRQVRRSTRRSPCCGCIARGPARRPG